MAKQTQKPSKSTTVTKLLSRGNGATVAEIMKATDWQQHSCRAFLTGLRKKSRIVKEQRSDGKLAYRIDAAPAEAEPAE